MDQPRWAERALPTADRPARRRVRRRDVLRALRARAAPATRRPRLRGHRLQVQRLGRLIAQVEERFGPRGDSPTTARRRGTAVPASGSATAPRRRSSRSRATSRSTARRRPPPRARCSRCWPAASPARRPRVSIPQAGEPSLRLLRRVGVVDPSSLADYRAHGGYAALRRALELGPEGVLRDVKDSKLVGRGGAAFPTGVKWEAVAHQPARPHYLVCNADESEPGTFKDRELMEGDPFAVLESMTIAAYATGCERGYVYLRGEYPQAQHALEHAVAEARSRGFLGDDVMGHGFSFDVELRRGRGRVHLRRGDGDLRVHRGQARRASRKPPFPVEVGLFGKPTVVNNVETLVNVLDIVLGRAPPSRRSAPRARPGRSSFASPATSRGPGRTRSGSARRCVRCSSSRAASRAGAPCRRCSSVARRGASSAPTTSTSR